jgi:translation initiation factor IF-1
MSKGDLIEFDGVLRSADGGGQYTIDLTDSAQTIRARLCGKMKLNKIRVIPGDKVKVSVSPYDVTHGIITQRPKNQ